jgi:hypothetical protein
MKTAEEWINEVGEAAGQDMFVPIKEGEKPGSRTENIIKQIQLDAWKQSITDIIKLIDETYGVYPSKKSIIFQLETIRDSATINEFD